MRNGKQAKNILTYVQDIEYSAPYDFIRSTCDRAAASAAIVLSLSSQEVVSG